MPLKGAYPKQMSDAIVDIAFLEKLKKTPKIPPAIPNAFSS